MPFTAEERLQRDRDRAREKYRKSVGGLKPTPSPKDRFWPKVEKTETCWLWTAATCRGYGHFRMVGSNTVLAHRIAYQWLVGPIPDGLVLDHLCKEHSCVNPAHLEPVTQHVNILRGDAPAAVNALKEECPRGHPYNTENTITLKNGRRWCRTCNKARSG